MLFTTPSTEAASTLEPDNFLTCLNPQEQGIQFTLFELGNTTEFEELDDDLTHPSIKGSCKYIAFVVSLLTA